HLPAGSGEFDRWDCSWAPVAHFAQTHHIMDHRRSPEVGKGLLLQMFSSNASTHYAESLSSSKFHLHRESCREAFHGNTIRILPLHHTTTTSPTMGLCYRPPAQIYPLSIPEQKAMEEYIEEALQQGYIRPSTSPAASSFFFITCIDYRALNNITVKFRYSLPLIPAALEQLRGARIFTKLDLRSAYNLIRIREGDEWKTAFVTPTGHYEYMNEVFQEFPNCFVLVYIDDILVYSRNEAEHRQHVSEVLKRLREHHLFLKAEKCTSIQFLGYDIGPKGIKIDERKVEAIRFWPTPTSIKELQRFLGFSNYYRRFIHNYSSITSPLANLQKGEHKSLSWTPEANQAMITLQQAFTSAPLLIHPDPGRPFVVEVDASTSGVGAILSQQQGTPPRLHPCAFFSKKLSPAKQNYDIGTRELLAIKLALEEWRHWLEGARHPFVVLTDHRNLEYLRDARQLSPRQARWALFFTCFDFTISYGPGTKNTKADALSSLHAPGKLPEKPESTLPPELIVTPIQWSLDEEIAAASVSDPTPPGCPPNRTYVPKSQRNQLIHSSHTSLCTGHPGTNQTLSLLQDRF
ncbi:hypothetical protein M9458_011063, partial [Cirrhinus mrigala]